MSGYTADIAALEHDATERFAVWSDTLDTVRSSVHGKISRADFSIVPGAQEVWTDYQRVTSLLDDYLVDGSETFDGFATRLLQTAQVYARADGAAVETLMRLQGEIDDL